MGAIIIGAKGGLAKPQTIRCYGVEWDLNSAGTSLLRLGDAASFSDPVPAIGTGDGNSPFDTLEPWASMDEFNVISNTLSYQRGSTNFSRTAYDTVVRVKKFWYKITKDSAARKMQFWIADGPADGYSVFPAFVRGSVTKEYIYIGKYKAGSGYTSKSGLAPLVSITRPAARTGFRGRGSNCHLHDYAALAAVQLLYLVEFADWNSQAKIGRGYVDGTAAINAGACDPMNYHTGRAAGTNGLTAIQYRGIENPWGDVWEWIDGINVNGLQAYVCTDPSKFADDTAANYTAVGYTCIAGSGSYPKELGHDNAVPWVHLPIVVGGSDASYIPDGWWTSTGWRVFRSGGYWSCASLAGLFAAYVDGGSSGASAGVGARLLFMP